ncbi:unnamed protein product [Closterium sp. Yama58-4]|nr:unnamed protein product [Closterium sp. Yama58-4]
MEDILGSGGGRDVALGKGDAAEGREGTEGKVGMDGSVRGQGGWEVVLEEVTWKEEMGCLHQPRKDRHVAVSDWQAHTVYHGYCPEDPQVLWFWEVVESLSGEQRKSLLFFATAVSNLPVNGFKGLTMGFHLHRADVDLSRLPTAHTCFHQFLLPPYESIEMMRTRLLTLKIGEDVFYQIDCDALPLENVDPPPEMNVRRAEEDAEPIAMDFSPFKEHLVSLLDFETACNSSTSSKRGKPHTMDNFCPMDPPCILDDPINPGRSMTDPSTLMKKMDLMKPSEDAMSGLLNSRINMMSLLGPGRMAIDQVKPTYTETLCKVLEEPSTSAQGAVTSEVIPLLDVPFPSLSQSPMVEKLAMELICKEKTLRLDALPSMSASMKDFNELVVAPQLTFNCGGIRSLPVPLLQQEEFQGDGNLLPVTAFLSLSESLRPNLTMASRARDFLYLDWHLSQDFKSCTSCSCSNAGCKLSFQRVKLLQSEPPQSDSLFSLIDDRMPCIPAQIISGIEERMMLPSALVQMVYSASISPSQHASHVATAPQPPCQPQNLLWSLNKEAKTSVKPFRLEQEVSRFIKEEISRRASGKPSQDRVLQQLKCLYMLHQTAMLCWQYGIRVAHLFLEQGLEVASIAHLAPLFKRTREALASAFELVEGGATVDHPKLSMLTSILRAHKKTCQLLEPKGSTASTGSANVLIVAENMAFFTMYKLLGTCQFQPFQLGRAGALSGMDGRGVSEGKWESMHREVNEALEVSDCLLVSPKYLVPSFPLTKFSMVIIYSDIVEAQDLHVFSSISEKIHILSVEDPEEVLLTKTMPTQAEKNVHPITAEKVQHIEQRKPDPPTLFTLIASQKTVMMKSP